MTTDWEDALLAFSPPPGGVPVKFVDFCRDIDVRLTPGQRAFAMVAFDGAEPGDLRGEDREYSIKLFGALSKVNRRARRTIAAVIGRRGGKSYVCVLRLLHLALSVSLHTLAPGEHAAAIIVGPTLSHARHTLQYVAGVLREKIPKAMGAEPTADCCLVRRPDGKLVEILCRAASRGGNAGRGYSIVGTMLEECAFFMNDQHVVNDVEIYRALMPALLPGGQALLASSPWGEDGLLYDFYSRNREEAIDAIAARAPTLTWRDTEELRAEIDSYRASNPEAASREFDAEFMSMNPAQFFATRAIEAAVKAWAAPVQHDASVTAAGGDFAFARNSSALAITVRDRDGYTVDDVEENKPDGMPLKPSAVVHGFALLMHAKGVTELMADGHYRESIAEHLETDGLELIDAPPGSDGKSTTHIFVRQLLNQGLLKLPNHPKLIRQMKDVKWRPVSGGRFNFDSPEWRSGEHGDLVSALVLSIYAASLLTLPEVKPKLTPGSAEWFEDREAARLARINERYERENSTSDSSWIWGPGR